MRGGKWNLFSWERWWREYSQGSKEQQQQLGLPSILLSSDSVSCHHLDDDFIFASALHSLQYLRMLFLEMSLAQSTKRKLLVSWDGLLLDSFTVEHTYPSSSPELIDERRDWRDREERSSTWSKRRKINQPNPCSLSWCLFWKEVVGGNHFSRQSWDFQDTRHQTFTGR